MIVIGGDPGYWYLTWDYRTKGMSADHKRGNRAKDGGKKW